MSKSMDSPFKRPVWVDTDNIRRVPILVAADAELICHMEAATKEEVAFIVEAINKHGDLREAWRAIARAQIKAVKAQIQEDGRILDMEVIVTECYDDYRNHLIDAYLEAVKEVYVEMVKEAIKEVADES